MHNWIIDDTTYSHSVWACSRCSGWSLTINQPYENVRVFANGESWINALDESWIHAREDEKFTCEEYQVLKVISA